MSYERGWSALNLEMTDKIPHTEFVDHDEFITRICGIKTDTTQPVDASLVLQVMARHLDYDYIWNVFEMPLPENARKTSLGHAVWNSIDRQDNNTYCPFASEEDVLAFNPVEEYGIPERRKTVAAFSEHYNKGQNELFPGAVFPGGRYNSLFSACIRSFGWEMLLLAAGVDGERFDQVLEGFYQITRAEVEAWIEAGIKVYNIHDDICWTSGPVMHPEWYRKYIFPRYRKLWEPLREAGIKVIFTSDGNYTEFFDDIFAAGADGIVLEPSCSLEYAAAKYGSSKVLIGNIDCRILQFGSRQDIYDEVARCAALGRQCPGYFFNVSNHIANGIKLENIYYYLECCAKLGRR